MAGPIISKITIGQAKTQCQGKCAYIESELLLFDKLEDAPMPPEPVKMGCLFVAMCTAGKAQYMLDTQQRQIAANDIIIVNEGQVVGDCLLSPDCRGVGIMLSYDFYHEIIRDVSELASLFLFSRYHPTFHLSDERAGVFLSYFNLIHQKIDDGTNYFRKQLAEALLRAMLYDMGNDMRLVRETSNKQQSRAEAIFTQFVRLVERNFATQRKVGWYGEQLCITPKYLSETVKLVSHRTPNEWIDNYVMTEIRVQLKNSNKSIKEISQDLHFPNQSFFGKYFKEHMGLSPSEYRRI